MSVPGPLPRLTVSHVFLLSPLNVSGRSVLAIRRQIPEEACGEPTAARSQKCRNINKLAVLEEAQDSGKSKPLSSVHNCENW